MIVRSVASMLLVLIFTSVLYAQHPQKVDIYSWNNGWISQATRTIAYDKEGRIIEDVTDEGGYYATKHLITYDSAGNIIFEEKYHKFSLDWELLEAKKYEYTYNSANILIGKLYKVYNKSSSTWVNSAKVSNTYSGSNIQTETWEYWSAGSWVSSAKYEYAYKGDTLISKTYYDWQGGWIPLSRENGYTWHELNKLPSSYIVQENDGAWQNRDKMTISYDSIGGSIILVQVWQADSLK